MAEPQLTYDINTDPFPLHANAQNVTITIVATNNTTKEISLDGFLINFPVGTAASQLTNAPAKIVAIAPQGLNAPEKMNIEGGVKFIYDKAFKVKPKQALVFRFNNIDLNAATGSVQLKATEVYSSSDQRIKQFTVTKFPQAWGKVTFTMEHPVIPFDSEAAMTWEGPAGATYSIEYYSYRDKKIIKVPEAGQPLLSNRGRYPSTGRSLKLSKTTAFVLNVELSEGGESYRAQEQKMITVADPPMPEIKSFNASKYIIDGKAPEGITLNWEVKSAAILELSGGTMATQTVTDRVNYPVTTNRSTMYQLKAITEDQRYITGSVEVLTFADFLNYHRFTFAETGRRTYDDYDGTSFWSELSENIAFYTNGDGRYEYLSVSYVNTRRGGTRETLRESEVLEFKWQVQNGEINCDLKAGAHNAMRFVCEIRGADLFYKTPPDRAFGRRDMRLLKQRLAMLNKAPEFIAPEEPVDEK